MAGVHHAVDGPDSLFAAELEHGGFVGVPQPGDVLIGKAQLLRAREGLRVHGPRGQHGLVIGDAPDGLQEEGGDGGGFVHALHAHALSLIHI